MLTTDNGANWATLTATSPNTLPTGAAVTGVAFDPSDPNTIYAATDVGVFKGALTPSSNAVSFIPFDEGLPNGLDINKIWIYKSTSIVSIWPMGHGTFQRDITPGVTCPGAFLVARDHVLDRGVTPSSNGLPDRSTRLPIRRARTSSSRTTRPAAASTWVESTDIRIDVPSVDDAAHTIATADNFEFESCPIEVSTGCPAGTMMDSSPVRDAPPTPMSR